jgi:hypothetical protein
MQTDFTHIEYGRIYTAIAMSLGDEVLQPVDPRAVRATQEVLRVLGVLGRQRQQREGTR